jgi:hypothetical protein
MFASLALDLLLNHVFIVGIINVKHWVICRCYVSSIIRNVVGVMLGAFALVLIPMGPVTGKTSRPVPRVIESEGAQGRIRRSEKGDYDDGCCFCVRVAHGRPVRIVIRHYSAIRFSLLRVDSFMHAKHLNHKTRDILIFSLNYRIINLAEDKNARAIL